MRIVIKNLKKEDYKSAVKIFTEGFLEEPLHIMAFPDMKTRIRCTRLVYELILFHLIPGIKRKAAGAYVDGRLVGVRDYTPPRKKIAWTPELDKAVSEMRRKAKDESINLIGEYAQTCGSVRPEEPHYYLNDMAVLRTHRGHGIGRKLLEYVEKQCLKNPSTVCTALDATNPKNVSLYKSWGYKTFKKIKFHTITCYKMKKILKDNNV
ncbi:MAG: GNAT family N-acetyltransferase [Bacteroidetes bacterium]|nr:GNAT family N-acetyltransferase [Bacteroidota bacterium]